MIKGQKSRIRGGIEPNLAPKVLQRGPVSNTKRCRRCTSTNIRKSKVRNIFESFVRILGFKSYRCRDCGYRFLRFL